MMNHTMSYSLYGGCVAFLRFTSRRSHLPSGERPAILKIAFKLKIAGLPADLSFKTAVTKKRQVRAIIETILSREILIDTSRISTDYHTLSVDIYTVMHFGISLGKVRPMFLRSEVLVTPSSGNLHLMYPTK